MSDPKLPIGTRFCKCSGCGEYFGGVSAFEVHRINFQCIPPAAVMDRHGKRVLRLGLRGYWSMGYEAETAVPELPEAA